MDICMYVHIRVYEYVCVCLYVCVSVCMFVCVCVYECVCVLVYVYMIELNNILYLILKCRDKFSVS